MRILRTPFEHFPNLGASLDGSSFLIKSAVDPRRSDYSTQSDDNAKVSSALIKIATLYIESSIYERARKMLDVVGG